MDGRLAALGQEFNAQLKRSDGELIANLLHGRLEQDLRDWFYDSLYARAFDPKWTQNEQITCEFKSRCEVSCFQAIEGAELSLRSGYVRHDCAKWFLEWCLHLTLGDDITNALDRRAPFYWQADASTKQGTLADLMSKAMSNTRKAQFYSELFAPMLFWLTQATFATIFGDHSGAKAAQKEHLQFSGILEGNLQRVTSGGGLWHVVEHSAGLFFTRSEQYGSLFHVWTTRELAEEMLRSAKMVQARGDGCVVATMDNRELGPQLLEFESRGMRFVMMDRVDESSGSLIPITRFIEVVQNAMRQIDATDFGRRFLVATGMG